MKILQNLPLETVFSAIQAENGDYDLIYSDQVTLQPLDKPALLHHSLIIHCDKGYLKGTYHKQEITFKKNEFAFLPYGEQIGIHQISDDFSYQAICLTPEFIKKIGTKIPNHFRFHISKNPIYRTLPQEEEILVKVIRLFKDVIAYQENCKADLVTGYLTMLFTMFVNMHFFKEEKIDMRTRPQHIYEAFIEEVKRHHRQEHNLSFYADRLYITNGYLVRVARSVGHTTVISVIRSFLIDDAKSLLEDKKDITIDNISKTLGFRSPTYFSRFFKKATGMTPVEFRTSCS